MTPSFFAKKVDFWTDCLKSLCLSVFEHIPLSVHFQSSFKKWTDKKWTVNSIPVQNLRFCEKWTEKWTASHFYILLIINDIRTKKVTVQKSTFFADF